MNTFRALYYTGESLTSQARTLEFRDNRLFILDQGVSTALDLGREYSCDVANHRLCITFVDGGRYEIMEPTAALIQALEPTRLDRLFRRHERRPFYLTLILTFALMGIFLMSQWGVPLVARAVILVTPDERLDTYSRVISGGLIDGLGKPSRLCPEARQQIRTKIQERLLAGKTREQALIRVNFRSGMGVNAFALPDGNIVLTDDLIHYVTTEQELMGIVGHEIGHVMERHALQRIIETLLLTFVWDVITGDLSSTAAAAASLPLVLQYSNYSKRAEFSADAYGKRLMEEQQMDPRYLAYFFAKLDGEERLDGEKKVVGEKLEPQALDNHLAGCVDMGALVNDEHKLDAIDEVLDGYLSRSDEKQNAGSVLSFISSHPLSKARVKRLLDHE